MHKGTAEQSSSKINSAVTAGDRLSSKAFMLDFLSIGAGIDTTALDTALGLIQNRVKIGEVVEFEQKPWGMEGEVKVCVNLLNAEMAQALRIEMKDAGVFTSLVQVSSVKDCAELKP
jgi:hypothetical protein